MSKLHLILKLIRQLRSKAILLMLITAIAEFAVIYVAGLYRLPRMYQEKLDGLSKNGEFIYFDTLGQKTDIESAVSAMPGVKEIAYTAYVGNLVSGGSTYFLKAVSSKICFAGSKCSPIKDNDMTLPQLICARSAFGEPVRGGLVNAELVIGSDAQSAVFRICGVVPDDTPVMNFQTGSNAVSAYNMFSPCGNDVYVYLDDPLKNFLHDVFGTDDSILYPSNGVILFEKGADPEARTAVVNTLLDRDISVQSRDEIEARTRAVSKNSIDTYSAIPLLIMALSLASSIALIVMSIDSEAKTIALTELIGCSRKQGAALLISAFGVVLVPGVIVNSVVLLAAILGGKQLWGNIWLTWGSFGQLAGTSLVFLIIIAAVSLLMMRGRSYTQRKIEEM